MSKPASPATDPAFMMPAMLPLAPVQAACQAYGWCASGPWVALQKLNIWSCVRQVLWAALHTATVLAATASARTTRAPHHTPAVRAPLQCLCTCCSAYRLQIMGRPFAGIISASVSDMWHSNATSAGHAACSCRGVLSCVGPPSAQLLLQVMTLSHSQTEMLLCCLK